MTQDTVGWSVIRTATEEDRRRLQHAAYRFCRRHHFDASALDRIGRAHGMPDVTALVDEKITLLTEWPLCDVRVRAGAWPHDRTPAATMGRLSTRPSADRPSTR